MNEKVKEFFESKFKEIKDLKDENEKLKKSNAELKEDLTRARDIIKSLKEYSETLNDLRWSLALKNSELEANNWRKDK
jgi:cell shape-determining protein MreC